MTNLAFNNQINSIKIYGIKKCILGIKCTSTSQLQDMKRGFYWFLYIVKHCLIYDLYLLVLEQKHICLMLYYVITIHMFNIHVQCAL